MVALITGIINLSLDGKIDYRWVAGGFLVAVGLYWVYRLYAGRYPFKKWRVTADSKELRAGEGSIEGRAIEGAWRFKASEPSKWAIYGPYIEIPLQKGKYRASFRIKVDDIAGENQPVVDIEVASTNQYTGDKNLAKRTLTSHDFPKADEYSIFPLDFGVYHNEGERKLEFRIFSRGSGHIVTLDYVQLSKKLF